MKQHFRFSVCLLVLAALLTGCSCFSSDREKKSNFEYTGLFLKVVDGDTFKAMFHGKMEYIRLAGIDCFETREGKRLKSQAKAQHIGIKQALKKGKDAEIKLADLLMYNGLLYIVPLKRDKYGRIIAQVYVKDNKGQTVNVNQYMYYKGLCSAFPDKSYYNNKAPRAKTKTVGKLDANGKKEGLWKTYREDGTLESERYYKNGKNHGIAKYYYKNGVLQSENIYKDGSLNGISKMYYDTGSLSSEINMVDSKMDGILKQYYDDGKILSETIYENGEKKGLTKYYYLNGEIIKADGVIKFYYQNGNVESERYLKNGKQEGLTKYYYSNGTLKSERNYENDNATGMMRFYNEDGSLKLETSSMNNLKFYYEDGAVVKCDNSGCNLYDKDGSLIK